MTVAFDALTSDGNSGPAGPGTVVFNHTPVGTPRGILYLCNQRTGNDQVSGVTYGGLAMTEVANSPLQTSAGVEPMCFHAFFLGASIPTGVQEVVVSTTNNSVKRHRVISLTAAGDTSVDTTGVLDSAGVQNPSVDVNTTAGTNTWIAGTCSFWGADTGTIAPGTGYTEIQENDAGVWVSSAIYRTANGTGGSYTVAWTTTLSAQAGAFAVAIKDSGGGGGGEMLDPMGMSGFFGA